MRLVTQLLRTFTIPVFLSFPIILYSEAPIFLSDVLDIDCAICGHCTKDIQFIRLTRRKQGSWLQKEWAQVDEKI